jgi:hypothetical protein
MIELKSTEREDGAEEELVPLFSLDGTTYSVPAKPRVHVALQYLTDARQHGEQMAQMMLLEKLLGEKGYKALSEFEDLTPEDLSAISDEAAKLTLGALEQPDSGNGSGGSRK